MPRIVTLCDSCTPAVVNDDWTHLDAGCQCNTAENDGHDDDCSAQRLHATVLGTMEILGWLTPIGDADEPGYFACALCSETQCSGGHKFETESDMR